MYFATATRRRLTAFRTTRLCLLFAGVVVIFVFVVEVAVAVARRDLYTNNMQHAVDHRFAAPPWNDMLAGRRFCRIFVHHISAALTHRPVSHFFSPKIYVFALHFVLTPFFEFVSRFCYCLLAVRW